jgi:pentalenene oxygenase
MTIVLATIAARWRLVPASDRPPQPKLAITMPVDALPMVVKRRDAPLSARAARLQSVKGDIDAI